MTFGENSGLGSSIVEELIPKKVRFRDKEEEATSGIMVDTPSDQPTSWRDKLRQTVLKRWDVQKTFVNGVPSITFSDRIHQILVQGMDNTVILKFLGRNMGITVLQNKIYDLWRPTAPMHMMDIENGYFLVKFQNKMDFKKALAEGPSIIFEFGEVVGKVVKLDLNTDSRTRGHFARLTVYVNLGEPLVSQILINGRTQKVEYEALSTICFHFGRYGHVENLCIFKSPKPTVEANHDLSATVPENQKLAMEESEKKDESYGLWMIVERKSRHKFRDNFQKSAEIQEKKREGSRFSCLNNRDLNNEFNDGEVADFQNSKEKEISPRNQYIKGVDPKINRLNDFVKNSNKGKQKECDGFGRDCLGVGLKTGQILVEQGDQQVGQTDSADRGTVAESL
ncbi:hypothetical protein GOBAR_AA30817 [Gossypium barbadense]|uniref:DUF4283 domain-containing protein n=1 Tax=Gossypium barbadense TaxID=3634 RepID=A0A2P5WFJ4_GOSBA|nr:hypothetical protein GOBAR_AA30817 [Gossypium barbadense]